MSDRTIPNTSPLPISVACLL